MLILAATATEDGRQLALKRRGLHGKRVATSGVGAIGVAMIEAALAVDAAALAPREAHPALSAASRSAPSGGPT